MVVTLDNIHTVVIIPLAIAGLCPQCNAIVNNRCQCPVCDSDVMPLAEKFEKE